MAYNRTMDDKEFRRRLSEVADWRIPETQQETSNNAKKKRGRKSNDEIYMELREQIFHEEFDGINNTIPPMLVRVKCQPTTCEDCGEHCPNGRKKETKLYETGSKKVRNWRERCLTCDKSKNPFTGKFDLTTQQASHIWTNYLRETKGLYKTAGNAARVTMSNPNGNVLREDDENIIISYPDSRQEK